VLLHAMAAAEANPRTTNQRRVLERKTGEGGKKRNGKEVTLGALSFETADAMD